MKKRTIAWMLAAGMIMGMLTGCGRKAETVQEPVGEAAEVVDETAEVDATEDVTGTYHYTEQAMDGALVIPWTLTLSSDGTYVLEEENPMAGTIAHTGTYEANGDIVSTSSFDEAPKIIAGFLNEDTSCQWKIDKDAETAEPLLDERAQGQMMPDGKAGGKPEAAEKIAYASQSPSQTLTIHKPEEDGRYPVIILVHGGGFLFGDSEMELIQPVIKKGVENGYAVVSVDYRKSGEAAFPAALSDVKAAVRYVRANAKQYGFDTEDITIWGESAGAYLSLMTALTPDVDALNGDVTDNMEYPSSVRTLVDFYGPVEFAKMDEEYEALGVTGTTYSSGDSFESKFLGQPLDEDLTKTYETYWETYLDLLPKEYTLDAWIQVGDADQKVPYTQSVNFAERLSDVLGAEHVYSEVIAGADHEDAAFYTDENLDAIFAFIKDTQD